VDAPVGAVRASNAASSQAGSMKYSINGTTISGGGVTYGKGTNKCNEFACDAVQSGTGYRPQVPKSGILGWLGFTRDPTAKEWATIAIPGYSGPLPLSTASPGDVIAMAHHDDPEGHVGIYVGNGMTASANAYQGGRITVNNWGFRGPGQNGEHAGDAGPVVRKWVGLP
jgi:cell wall-associated NlpC family hydrolase